MIKSWSNWKPTKVPSRERVSRTQPGLALSLRTLLNRHVSGQEVKAFTPVYTDDPMFPPGMEFMDTIQRAEYAAQLRTEIDDYRVNAPRKVREARPAPDAEPLERSEENPSKQ